MSSAAGTLVCVCKKIPYPAAKTVAMLPLPSACVCVRETGGEGGGRGACVFMCVCACVCFCVAICVCAFVCVLLCVCFYVCAFVCACVWGDAAVAVCVCVLVCDPQWYIFSCCCLCHCLSLLSDSVVCEKATLDTGACRHRHGGHGRDTHKYTISCTKSETLGAFCRPNGMLVFQAACILTAYIRMLGCIAYVHMVVASHQHARICTFWTSNITPFN